MTDDLGHPLLGPTSGHEQLQRRITLAVYLSLAANISLALVKGYAFIVSWSMSVLASFIDSLIDLASQAVIAWADWQMAREDARFPAGKSRLETVAVLACAAIMTFGALQVVSESSQQLYNGFARGQLPALDMTPLMYAILGVATVLKLGLWAVCFTLRHQSGAALALAEDHINDVFSNAGAIITAAIASQYPERCWWSDPVGGILISLYIAARWAVITRRQVDKVVGVSAPREFVEMVRELAALHDPQCKVGFLRAYHAGQRLHVDVELVAPSSMTVAEASHIARDLKGKIEALAEVECACIFVTHHASGVFWPCHAPLMAPATRCKPHTTATDVDELLLGLQDGRSLPSPLSSPPGSPPAAAASGRAGPGGALASEGGGAPWPLRRQPSGPIPIGAPSTAAVAATASGGDAAERGEAEAEGEAGAGEGRDVRRVASVSDALLRSRRGSMESLRHASQPSKEPLLARHLAWSRSIKDPPERVLQSAALSAPDTAAMFLSRLARRSLDAGPPLPPRTQQQGPSQEV